MNAERLLNDSRKNVSEPTKAALLELSLEELSKSYRLLLQCWFTKATEMGDDKADSAFEKTVGPELWKAAKENDKMFEGLPNLDSVVKPMNIKEFRNHIVKLENVASIVTMFKVVVPIMFEHANLGKIAGEKVSYIDFTKAVNWKRAGRSMEKTLSAIREENLADLTALKENGFYVDYENGNFISPSARVFATDHLRDLVSLLATELKGEIRSIAAFGQQPTKE